MSGEFETARGVVVTDGMREEAARMVVYGGYTRKEVAERFSVCARTVRRWVKRFESRKGARR